jgi:hypothetical protein
MRRKKACCNSQSVEIKNFIVIIIIIALRRKLSGVVNFSKILFLSLSLSLSLSPSQGLLWLRLPCPKQSVPILILCACLISLVLYKNFMSR